MKKLSLKLVFLALGFITLALMLVNVSMRIASDVDEQTTAVARAVKLPFHYAFLSDGLLHEAGTADTSSSPYWWLNSGGLLLIMGGVGMTNQGNIVTTSKWYKLYKQNNPIDTDDGLHPQNIFRIVTRLTWDGNIRQEVYANIVIDQLSASPNRNASNGILLFNRYKDANNLYYAGIRVDGAVVVKKKLNGKYYTLAQKQLFFGATYNRDTNVNLLPKNKWIGVRADTVTNADKSVTVKLFIDEGKTGKWTEVLSAVDNGIVYGGPAIEAPGYGGFRTDFMDVLFDDYRIVKI